MAFDRTLKFRARGAGVLRKALAPLVGALLVMSLACSATTATAAMYIGAGLTEVKAGDRAVIAHPQPVQLLFVFQTKGAPNAAATKFTKQMVTDTVKASGLFSEVSEAPVANGAILSVVINNVVEPQEMRDAEAKGALTGATFFVAGSNVTDHYIGTVDYVSGPTAPKISKSARQILITQLGLINSAPKDAIKVGGGKAAITALVTQIVGNPLNDVGKDPGFQVAEAGPTAAASAPAAPAPATQAALTPAPASDPAQPPPSTAPAADTPSTPGPSTPATGAASTASPASAGTHP
jgi:hypothetical protein